LIFALYVQKSSKSDHLCAVCLDTAMSARVYPQLDSGHYELQRK